MTHHTNTIKRLAVTAIVAAAVGASSAPAWSATPAHRIAWTKHQLEQLASAYAQKNPGWVPPEASTARTPAQKTWTASSLDRLAAAYSALNPSWTRP